MGFAEPILASCTETHEPNYAKQKQEQVMASSCCATIPGHSMVVSTERTFSPQYSSKVVLFSPPSLAESSDSNSRLRSESGCVLYPQISLIPESYPTLSEESSWMAASKEQPGSILLGDDLPNETVVTRKNLLYQIRCMRQSRTSGVASIAQLRRGFPCFPHTRLLTFPLRRAVKFRQCPGEKAGSGGGGAGGRASGSSDWDGTSVSAFSNNFLSSLVTGRGGNSGDDDDPFNNSRRVELPRGHYADFDAFEFDPSRDIPNLDEFLQDITFPSLESMASSQAFNETRSAPVFREDVSDPAPMTPAPPMTPGCPMTPGYSAPLTPSGSTYLTDPVQAMTLGQTHHHSSTMTLPLNYGPNYTGPTVMPASDPVHGSLVSPHQAHTPEKSELENLLDINRLLRKPSSSSIHSESSHPRPPSGQRRSSGLRRTPYTAPHPSRPHMHASMRPSQPSAAVRPVQRIQSPKATHTSVHFFKTTYVVQGNRLVIGVQVDPMIAASELQIAHQALLHCYQLCMRYKECLDEQCELAVAMQNKASLCEFSFDFPKMKLSFNMPSDCLLLEKWMERNTDQDICARQLIVQQVVNTLANLFQGANQISFWGSFQVWVASNMKVYLFIDFNKSLQVQKQYSSLGQEQNPRLEDSQALANLYNTVLRPFLNSALTWASPQLGHVFSTFERLLADPQQCMRNMSLLARVLGERRVCKLEVVSELLLNVQYTVYCAEHEPLSSSLTVLERVLPTMVCSQWAVLRSMDCVPVRTTDIAARGCPYQFMLVPHPDDQPQIPAALYLTCQS